VSETKSKSEPESEPKLEPREPRALSNEYHKARKQLMFWAAILFIWELVGIDLEKAKEAGGNAGAIIGALKSPQAVPWALLILIAYFAFKLSIEWGQCNRARRRLRASRLDYYSAFIVAGTAFALYFAQAIIHIQIANELRFASSWSLLLGIFVAGLPIGIGTVCWRYRSLEVVDVLAIIPAPLVMIALTLLGISFPSLRPHWKLLFVGRS
jgi:hypothetical protein